MWFCTDAGVARFDGKHFQQFTRSDGLSDNEVFRMFEDRESRIWFLTYNGHLSFYKDGKFYSERNTPWLKKMFASNSFTSAFQDKNGLLYFGTFGEKFVVLKDSTPVIYNAKDAYGSFCFYEKSNGEITISNASQRYIFKDGKLNLTKTKFQRSDVRYFVSRFNNELFYSDKGLVQIDESGEKVIVEAKELPSYNAITGILETADSAIYVTTRSNGLIVYPSAENQTRSYHYSLLKGKIVLSVFVDKEGNTWINTEGNGIYLLSNAGSNVINYTAENGLADVNIKRIIKAKDNSLWLACGKQTVVHIKEGKITNLKLRTFVNSRQDRVLDLALDNKENLWAATDNGIVRLDSKNKEVLVRMLENNKEDYVSAKCLSVDTSGNIIATYFMGIAYLNNTGSENDYFKPINASTNRKRTYCHYSDNYGRLWVANIDGLNLIENNIWTRIQSDDVLKERILQIGEAKGMMVIALSDNGIVFLKKNKLFKHITKRDGLPSDICRRFYYFNNSIWVATNKGVAEIKIDEQIEIGKIFNKSSGILSDDIHDILIDSSSIYIATDQGLSVLNIENTTVRSSPPDVYFTNFLVNNRSVPFDGAVSLSYTENTILASFVAPVFNNPENVMYSYKFGNSETRWINTANRSIEFSGLLPGNYQLSIRAKKEDSSWGTEKKIIFIIHPPYWKTWWFRLLITGFLIFIIYYLQKVYVRQKLRKRIAEMSRKELILNERSRISSDMHDDLGADLSRIVVLSEVLRVKEKVNENTASHLDKITRYANDLREKVDEIIWALNPKHDTLSDLISYIHHYALDFFEDAGIKQNIVLPDHIPGIELSAIFRRSVFLVVKEAFHNTIKHAGASSTTIKIILEGTSLCIYIQDDGRGSQFTDANVGNGMKNMKERAALLGGSFTVLQSSNGFAVQLTVPLIQ